MTAESLFSQAYTDLLDALLVRESPDRPFDESILQKIWLHRFFRQPLRMGDGRPVRILDVGERGSQSGPDFRGAQIETGTRRIQGDIEIHIDNRDWQRHGHDRDPAYDRVILHVALDGDRGLPLKNADGKDIRQVFLSDQKDFCIVEVMQQVVSVENAGNVPCASISDSTAFSDRTIGLLLDLAGDERMLRKAARLRRLGAGASLDAAIYAETLAALGYSRNTENFRELAQRMTFDMIVRVLPIDADAETMRETAEAALFGAAGLLPPLDHKEQDKETRTYCARLRALWERIRADLHMRFEFAPIPWSFKDARPTNYPPRRLAGFAGFLVRCLPGGIVRALLAACERAKAVPNVKQAYRSLLDEWTNLLIDASSPYWLHRSRWGEKTLERKTRLIGRQRAMDIVVNVFLPGLLAQARDNSQKDIEAFLHGFYTHLPPSSGDRITRLMASRLFVRGDRQKNVVHSIRRQQGLHQIYRDCCQKTGGACHGCLILDLASALTEMSVHERHKALVMKNVSKHARMDGP